MALYGVIVVVYLYTKMTCKLTLYMGSMLYQLSHQGTPEDFIFKLTSASVEHSGVSINITSFRFA